MATQEPSTTRYASAFAWGYTPLPETNWDGVVDGVPDHLLDDVPAAGTREGTWLERNFGWACLGLVVSLTTATFTATVVFGTTSVVSYGIAWILAHIVFLCIAGIAAAAR